MVEVPFVFFAVLLPFVATGPETEVLGVSVSQHGLEAGIALLVKGTLGVLASLTLAADHRAAGPRSWASSGSGCPSSSCRSWRSWSATSTS